ILLSGNTASGNSRNGFVLQGSIGGDVTWDGDDFFPFVVWEDLYINGNAKLTLTPGTVVKFNDFWDDIQVNGTLVAEGSASQPVYFTTLSDDGPGGDTNNDGDKTSPAPDAWSSLRFNAGSEGVLKNAVVRYGGGQYSENVYIATDDVAISGSTIAYSSDRGLTIAGSAPTIAGNAIRDNGVGVYAASNAQPILSDNRITGNTSYGVFNAGTAIVNAEDNWWGSVKGPFDPDDDTGSGGWHNPDGEGDRVSNRVDYEPWLAFTGLLHGMRIATGDNPAQVINYEYDELNRTDRLTASGPVETVYVYDYDAGNRLISVGPETGSSGVVATLTHNANGQPTRITSRNPGGNVTFSDLRYTYDNVGNVLTMQDGAGTTNYGYDDNYRLTSANGPGLSETYAWDAAGNRTGKSGVTFTYDAAGQLTSSSDGVTYTYDGSGNRVTRTQSGQVTTYNWDARGRLTRIDYPDGSHSAYTYDAQDRRISKRDRSGNTIYFVYDGMDLVQEVGANGVVLANYVYDGLDNPIAMQRGNATYYYVRDRLGSIIGLSNGASNLVASYRYDPWGNVISTGGSNPALQNPFRFAGREYDAESGLYFYRSRYYDPATASFISRDRIPIYEIENAYVYAAGNPVRQTDPIGLDASDRRWWQGVGGFVVGVGAGAVFIFTAPVSGPIALAVGATVAGGVAGGAAAAASEVALASNCDRDILGAFVAGGKGGLTGGSLASNVLYFYGAEVTGGMRAVAHALRPPGPNLAQTRASIELSISAAKRMATDFGVRGDWVKFEFYMARVEALQRALGNLPPMF
ncbi:MAG: right-handed parallel beta-helix repeat-containing protein, partial [Caldilineales bacterium]|nr:right-handed parallel beta-helix repeat-containing protein [Caldilineales bacterium]